MQTDPVPLHPGHFDDKSARDTLFFVGITCKIIEKIHLMEQGNTNLCYRIPSRKIVMMATGQT